MAKHVYPPLGVGVADTSSVDLNLDVTRIITASTIFGGSGGDFGVAANSARSDHTHITSYDGRYVLKAGDTMSGNLAISKSDAQIVLQSTNAGNSAYYAYDTTDGGGAFFASDGNVLIAQIDASGIWVTNRIIIDKATGSIGLYPSGLIVSSNHAANPGLDIIESGAAVTFRVRANSGGLAYIQFTDAAASAEWATIVATSGLLSFVTGAGGFSFNQKLTVLPKGSIFGQAIGGNISLTQADAAIITYANSANNWAGFGSDVNGNIWVRTGLSGTPDHRALWDTSGNFTANNAYIRSKQNSLNFIADTPGAGQRADYWFYDNGSPKWAIIKDAIHSWGLFNQALTRNEITVTAAGAISLTSLGGGGNRVVTTDNNGTLLPGAFASVGASMVLLYTNTFAAAASLSLPANIFTSAYPFYLIKIVGVTLNTVAASLIWRGRVSGVDDSGAAAYKYHGQYMTTGGISTNFGASTTFGIALPGIAGNIINTSASIWLENPSDATLFTMLRSEFEGTWNGSDWYGGWASGQYSSSRSHDSMSFIASSGTVALSVYVWGLRAS